MSYNYATHRAAIFTEEGQVVFLKVRDQAKQLLRTAGAFLAEDALRNIGGDSWTQLACLDRLVELREIVEVANPCSSWGQHRLFVDPGRRP